MHGAGAYQPGWYPDPLHRYDHRWYNGSTWTSVFTTTPGLPAAFWRNAARHAGAHVWCEQDELVMADAGLVGPDTRVFRIKSPESPQ